jgi:hypothetical protein
MKKCAILEPPAKGAFNTSKACETGCKSVVIPQCNATNYYEYWCYAANTTDSFESLATKLHVNPTKLWEYNFLYNREMGVVLGDSLRVPYGACPTQYLDPYSIRAWEARLRSVF